MKDRPAQNRTSKKRGKNSARSLHDEGKERRFWERVIKPDPQIPKGSKADRRRAWKEKIAEGEDPMQKFRGNAS